MKLRTKFQDEDFELGEVVTADIATLPDGRIKLEAAAKKGGFHTILYYSLEELNEEWEDYEEPKVIYYISWDGVVLHSSDKTGWQDTKQIGNYFETEEEAEKAVEKLKAWKRLKDKGFRFGGWEDCNGKINTIYFCIPENKWGIDTCDDLKICFGDEE